LKRLERVGQLLLGKADAYLTVDEAENFYLTRFPSTFGVSVVTARGDAYFFTDGRYLEKAKEEVRGFKVLEWKGWDRLAQEVGVSSCLVSPDRLKLSTYLKVKEAFPSVLEEEGFLNPVRAVKDEEELSYIVRAVQIAELALKSVLHLLKPGVTELEFRRELISAFFRFGGEGEAFPTIVASGEGSAIPHWKTSRKEIRDGEAVVIDFGTRYRGFVSDVTRTFLVGKVPSELKEIYDAVYSAQQLGIKALKSGKPCRSVDAEVRSYLEKKGYGRYFVHSLGHGIGVEVHEAPTLSSRSDEVLREGNVVTVEPGVYVPGLGGVRIEDDCVVTEEGAFSLNDL